MDRRIKENEVDMIVHNYGRIPKDYICDGNERSRDLNTEEINKIKSLGVDEIWYWCIDFIDTEDFEGGGGDGMLLMRCGSDYDFWVLEDYSGDDDDLLKNIKFGSGRSLNTLGILFCEDESLKGLMETTLPLIEMAHGAEKKKTRGKQTTMEEDFLSVLIGD